MRRRKFTRRGSYIVEAVIVVPVFIAAVLMLISIIPAAAVCENIVFSSADELRLEMFKSAFRKNPAALPANAAYRIRAENPKLRFYQIRGFRYLYREEGIEDLIRMDFRAVIKEENPFDFYSSVIFDGSLAGRAFTGKLHRETPGRGTEERQIVYIFPEWGKRYHRKQCTYVQSNCRLVYLSQETKKKYMPCKLCEARSAQIGTPVFCFTDSGRAYHTADCRTVDKYYTEMEKADALEKGYTPCEKCGGG